MLTIDIGLKMKLLFYEFTYGLYEIIWVRVICGSFYS
jgi:hypothetical protein